MRLGGADLAPPNDRRFTARLVHFTRVLRKAGLTVGPGCMIEAIRVQRRKQERIFSQHKC